MIKYEQGPIRPPSEAESLLVRVSRNCPWNRCAFCPVYKGTRFSLRTVAEVLADLDAMKRAGGFVPRSAFLQDANALLTRPDDLARIVLGLRERFASVCRITTYARAHTLRRRSLAELRELRDAGLDRLHVGLESGSDAVLESVQKGATREEQIEGGLRAKEAGFELSEYVMPGLGGKRLSATHVAETASALRAIQPDFVRLRTTVVLPGTELACMAADESFLPLGDIQLVQEIRALLEALGDVSTRVESDHEMNLLMELRGQLPADRERLLGLCDAFLDLPANEQRMFILGRRLRLVSTLSQLDEQSIRDQLESILADLSARGRTMEDVFAEILAKQPR